MSLEEKDRQRLVEHRINKAVNTINDVQFLIDNDNCKTDFLGGIFMDNTKIMIQGKTLSVLLVKDGQEYGAFCPELDLVTEMDTPEEAIEDLIESIKDYADEYINELELYSKSPNRAHHLPYIESVKACKTDWDIRMLMEIKHGNIHV